MKKIFMILGYVFYSFIVLLALLYLKFPGDTVRHWLENMVESKQPKITCHIRELKPTFLGGIEISQIVLGTTNKKNIELVKIESLGIRPRLMSLLPGSKAWKFRVAAIGHGGIAKGNVQVGTSDNTIGVDLKLKKINLQSFIGVSDMLMRKVEGSLSGKVSWNGIPGALMAGSGSLIFSVSDGLIGLQKSLFGIKELDFTTCGANLLFADGKGDIVSGKFDSRLFLALFAGKVTLNKDMLLSTLEIDGNIEPRPELFTSQKGNKEVLNIRKQLKGGKLPFSLTGTLREPGILLNISGS